MRKITILLISATLFISSCSYIPFIKKKDEAAKTSKKSEEKDKKAGKKEVVNIEEAKDPKPGDIKVIDGVEYIYARNRRYVMNPGIEPENVWVRKDQYSPGLMQSIVDRVTEGSKKEKTAMEQRIAKLEEELKKKNIAPQVAYPTQMSVIPGGVGFMSGAAIPFDYPSPKMKRRVIVLPATDQTNYKDEHLGELATRRLVSRLEGSGTIVCVDPATTGLRGSLTEPGNLKTLNEVFGVQAILKGTLSDVYTSTSRIGGKEEKEASFAMSRLSVDVINTETGALLKQLSGRNPVFLSREKGDLSGEKAKIKSIDLTIEMISEDLMKTILYLDWHARIASIEEGKIYINAGRLSGLEKGKILEVYAPGEKIIDNKTNKLMGTTRGAFKGELEVVELFGVDASWTKAKTGGSFSATDLVYVKQ